MSETIATAHWAQAKLIASEYIHDNAWSEQDRERLGIMNVGAVIEEMRTDSHRLSECQCCLKQGIDEHTKDCKLNNWLGK